MEPGLTKRNAFFFTLHLLYLVFFASIIFSFRAFSSISIAGILLIGLIGFRWTYSSLVLKKPVVFFLAGCLTCFLFTLAAILYTQDLGSGWSQVRLKTGLVVIPLAVFFTAGFISLHKKRLLLYFILILLAASLYCVVISISLYLKIPDTSVFFYHELVSPVSQHAVYFSVFVFIALVSLLENMGSRSWPVPRSFALLLIGFFSVFLFLLSSKLAIVFYGLYLLFFIIRSARIRMIRRSMALGLLFLLLCVIALILLTKNPLSNRFRDIVSGDIKVTKKEKYNPGDYFNGVQLRLLEWKFVSEILSENKKWLLGVSPGDAQRWLDQKYISKNMYTGDPSRHDRGFLGYNTHNQFLESLLQVGIMGAMAFTLTWLSLLAMVWEKKDQRYTVVAVLLLVYAWVESILETQYGIILFTFFPLFFYIAASSQPADKTRKPDL